MSTHANKKYMFWFPWTPEPVGAKVKKLQSMLIARVVCLTCSGIVVELLQSLFIFFSKVIVGKFNFKVFY